VNEVSSILQVECESGYILIMDPAIHSQLSDDLWYWLEVFAHPEGDTQLAGDWEEPWSTIYERARQTLSAAAKTGQFIIIKAARGRYFVQIDKDATATAMRRSIESSSARVTISSGRVQAFDGPSPSQEVAGDLPSGDFAVTVHTLRPNDGDPEIVGIFGSAERPALLIVVRPSSRADDTAFHLLPCSLKTAPAPGRLCRAQAKSVDDSIAVLRLRLTDRIWSGYGRLRIPEGHAVAVGSPLLVKLVEHTGSFWWCEPSAEPPRAV